MITIEASALAGALKNAASIVSTANTMPILSNVRAIAKGGKLELVTCGLDMEFRQTITVKGDIAFTANAAKLSAIAGAVPGDRIEAERLLDRVAEDLGSEHVEAVQIGRYTPRTARAA